MTRTPERTPWGRMAESSLRHVHTPAGRRTGAPSHTDGGPITRLWLTQSFPQDHFLLEPQRDSAAVSGHVVNLRVMKARFSSSLSLRVPHLKRTLLLLTVRSLPTQRRRKATGWGGLTTQRQRKPTRWMLCTDHKMSSERPGSRTPQAWAEVQADEQVGSPP